MKKLKTQNVLFISNLCSSTKDNIFVIGSNSPGCRQSQHWMTWYAFINGFVAKLNDFNIGITNATGKTFMVYLVFEPRPSRLRLQPQRSITEYELSLSRNRLKILVALITGYCRLTSIFTKRGLIQAQYVEHAPTVGFFDFWQMHR
jgi:hypothetical protein